MTTRHPEEVEAAIAYLARRGQTDPGAIRWSYSALDLGSGPDGAPRVNLRLIGVAGDERVSVHLPSAAWPPEAVLHDAGQAVLRELKPNPPKPGPVPNVFRILQYGIPVIAITLSERERAVHGIDRYERMIAADGETAVEERDLDTGGFVAVGETVSP